MEPNHLWQNDGQGNITDTAGARGVAGSGHTIGSAFGDFDNDGHLDLFEGNFSHPGNPSAKFLRNLGPDGGYNFRLMDELDRNDWQESYASPSLADYDNDGDIDLYFTTVYVGNHARLYRNDGNWNFTNVTGTEGLGGMPATYQAAWADYDNDGDLDVLTAGTLYVNDASQQTSNNGTDLVSVHVDNVQSNQFDIFLTEPSNKNGMHGTETVNYVVMEAGVHVRPDGTRIEVGTVTGDRRSWHAHQFNAPYADRAIGTTL